MSETANEQGVEGMASFLSFMDKKMTRSSIINCINSQLNSCQSQTEFEDSRIISSSLPIAIDEQENIGWDNFIGGDF